MNIHILVICGQYSATLWKFFMFRFRRIKPGMLEVGMILVLLLKVAKFLDEEKHIYKSAPFLERMGPICKRKFEWVYNVHPLLSCKHLELVYRDKELVALIVLSPQKNENEVEAWRNLLFIFIPLQSQWMLQPRALCQFCFSLSWFCFYRYINLFNSAKSKHFLAKCLFFNTQVYLFIRDTVSCENIFIFLP